ncbi:uncharacterized protein LOC6547597 [Drosophila erecta]|uniref:Uncharacterized protein n=1 Tax=Drosophila erecta TaxID=7220 RepID=B3NK73_DROER|nr:uncharacterized protein LOC6547597 [Drosophila erecta]EDV55296.2 uncharacterized protein Dere_GG22025 [Drosophila erecta]
MRTMSMRIWSHAAVGLSLQAIAILASAERATGRSEGTSEYRYPYVDTPWPRRQYSSEERDAMDLREMAPSEPRYLSDPEVLFQRLDDMEQKLGIPDRMAPTGKLKSEKYLVGPKNIAAQLFKDNLHKFPIDEGEDGLYKEEEDPFDSLARMNFNEQLREYKPDRELKRMLGGYRNSHRDGKPAVATANLLAKVVSSKVDQPRKSGTCRGTTGRPMSTTKSTTTHRSTVSTTTRGPTTFCLPEPSSEPVLPTPSPTPRPPPISPSSPPTARKPNGQPNRCSSQKPGAVKVLLDTILATKQLALSVLKNLNYLEMELLSHSPDDDVCAESDDPVKENEAPTKTSERFFKTEPRPHYRVFSFGIRPASQKESLYDLALAKEEELKLEDRVWKEHQQQMKLKRPIKPKRFEAAPANAARLEPFQEPRQPPKSLKPMEDLPPFEPETSTDNRRINLEALSVVVKPLSTVPRKDSPNSLPRAQMNAIQLEGTSEDQLQPSHSFHSRPRKKKKHKLYAMEQQPQAKRLPIAGVFY